MLRTTRITLRRLLASVLAFTFVLAVEAPTPTALTRHAIPSISVAHFSDNAITAGLWWMHVPLLTSDRGPRLASVGLIFGGHHHHGHASLMTLFSAALLLAMSFQVEWTHESSDAWEHLQNSVKKKMGDLYAISRQLEASPNDEELRAKVRAAKGAFDTALAASYEAAKTIMGSHIGAWVKFIGPALAEEANARVHRVLGNEAPEKAFAAAAVSGGYRSPVTTAA